MSCSCESPGMGGSVNDPLTVALAAGTVLHAAVIATLVPAVRIARVNPIKALRQP